MSEYFYWHIKNQKQMTIETNWKTFQYDVLRYTEKDRIYGGTTSDRQPHVVNWSVHSSPYYYTSLIFSNKKK
jgi:hypothetical protein